MTEEPMIEDRPYCTKNGYAHVTKCPNCQSWVFYDEHHITKHSVGGQIIKRGVECSNCGTEITLFAWGCL